MTTIDENEALEPQKPQDGAEGTAPQPEESKPEAQEIEAGEEAQTAAADEATDHAPSEEEKPAENDGPQKENAEAEAGEPEETAEEEADDQEEEEEEDTFDPSQASTEELANHLEAFSHSENFKKIGNLLREIGPLVNSIKDELLKTALEAFKADGGDEGDFAMHWDETIQRIDANLRLMRDRRSKFLQGEEERRQKNLAKKEGLLNTLRELVDGEESLASLNAIREIQNEWKATGDVPGMRNGELWASYKALMDRYYDQRSILNELKDLDRKKNLEHKLELCEKAEKLADIDDVRIAIRALNDLHEEFKHIGPIPREEQDAVWDRFKAASDVIYQRRRAFQDAVKGELQENLVKKQELIEKAEVFANFASDRIKEWNSKTKELQNLQKEWEKVGGLPRNKSKEVNKAFWAAFKTFFQNKGKFFKGLEAEREENLKKKQEMVARAQELSQSDDFNSTADKLKALQEEWRTVGPVPEKFRDSVYQEFKKACDTFFNRKRDQGKAFQAEYKDNLKKKEELCEEIMAMARASAGTQEQLEEFVNRWSGIGYVPKEAIRSIQQRYDEALEAYAKSIDGMSRAELKETQMKVELYKLKAEPDANRKLNQKEAGIRKKISAIENDIALWKNNMEFFTTSVKADKLLKDFEKKVQEAENQIIELKKQLEVLKEL